MFSEFGALGEADHGLPQHPFVTAHDGVGGVAASGRRPFELLTGQGFERDPLRDMLPPRHRNELVWLRQTG
jgi:hypothetical protein